MPPLIGRLHILTDDLDIAKSAQRGGADIVQYREKRDLSFSRRLEVAERIAAALRGTKTRLVINDHVDVARESKADGVHLGQRDDSWEDARKVLGDAALIGATANSRAEIERVIRAPIDYVGVGPVFATQSKADAEPPLGVDRFREIVKRLKVPVIAIGGIIPDRVADLIAAGAWGIAAIAHVVHAEDPEAATREFRQAIDEALRKGESGF